MQNHKSLVSTKIMRSNMLFIELYCFVFKFNCMRTTIIFALFCFFTYIDRRYMLFVFTRKSVFSKFVFAINEDTAKCIK